jgi:hypothetical protein
LAQQEIEQLAEDLKDKEVELQKIRANLNMAKMSHASGFSIETENDKLKSQLTSLKQKLEDEKT